MKISPFCTILKMHLFCKWLNPTFQTIQKKNFFKVFCYCYFPPKCVWKPLAQPLWLLTRLPRQSPSLKTTTRLALMTRPETKQKTKTKTSIPKHVKVSDLFAFKPPRFHHRESECVCVCYCFKKKNLSLHI